MDYDFDIVAAASKPRKKMQEELNAWIEKYRPKEISRYMENGKVVRVFEPAYAKDFYNG